MDLILWVFEVHCQHPASSKVLALYYASGQGRDCIYFNSSILYQYWGCWDQWVQQCNLQLQVMFLFFIRIFVNNKFWWHNNTQLRYLKSRKAPTWYKLLTNEWHEDELCSIQLWIWNLLYQLLGWQSLWFSHLHEDLRK